VNDRPLDVDEFLASLFVGNDAVLKKVLERSQAAGLPPIAVSAAHGKMLYILARALRARRILEIGTLGGYSAIWLARALPRDGKLITLEIDHAHAVVARANLELAGVAHLVELRQAAALVSLQRMIDDAVEPFDLIFIDADKPNNPEYLRYAIGLAHHGTLIVLDNVIRDGEILDANSSDPAVAGTRRALEMMASHPRLASTAIQTVGQKGYDGFAISFVT
jgi:predicted O-methyltransferase YrrM